MTEVALPDSAAPRSQRRHRRDHTSTGRSGFRRDIEGLRALAVIGVVGYHAAAPFMTGGYIGVDVFFVISGFLITGLLVGQVARDGRFRLRDFYARRARRILPAAGVVMVATAVASVVTLPPLVQRDVAKDIVACALNVGVTWCGTGS